MLYVTKSAISSWRVEHFLGLMPGLKEGWDVGTGRRELLRIVDFGAGTSAGRIGAALMAAKALEDGRSIDHIHFDEIDISSPMLEMGELVWQAFTQEVQSKVADSALAYAVKVIHPCQHREWSNVKGNDCETWLTAFHVTYQEQNRADLKKIITTLYQRVGPVAGAFQLLLFKRRGRGQEPVTDERSLSF